jgi:hypothetical protein
VINVQICEYANMQMRKIENKKINK